MGSDRPHRAHVGCYTCDLELVLETMDVAELREAFARFFAEHAECRTCIDVALDQGTVAEALRQDEGQPE